MSEPILEKVTYKPGDKFILEIGNRQIDTFKIAGTDYYIKISLLDKLTPYKPEENISKQKTGKWLKVYGYATPGGDPVWQCSECGKGIHVYGIEHSTYGKDIADGQWKACPNCTAQMKGENE